MYLHLISHAEISNGIISKKLKNNNTITIYLACGGEWNIIESEKYYSYKVLFIYLIWYQNWIIILKMMSNVKELVAKFEQDQKEIFASLDKLQTCCYMENMQTILVSA